MKKLSFMVLLVLCTALGCKLSGILSGGAGSGSGGAAGSSSDPHAAVADASRKLIALPSFSAKMDGMGQTEIKSQVDYQAPDRYHITYLAGTGAGMEMIVIGDQMFMKTGGKWNKSPGSGAASIPTLRDSFTEDGLKKMTDAKYEGDETVDGRGALVYSYKNVTPKGDFPFSAKMWVAKDTGVPIKVVVDYANGVLKQMTVNYDTQTPVSIEPPAA